MSSVYVWMFWMKCLGLEGQQEDCSMSEVTVRRNCGRRNSSWFAEQPVDQSAPIDAGGWRQWLAILTCTMIWFNCIYVEIYLCCALVYRDSAWGLHHTAGRSMAADLQRWPSCFTGTTGRREFVRCLPDVAASTAEEVNTAGTHRRFDIS